MSVDPFAAFFGQHLYFEAAYYPVTNSAGRFERARLEALLRRGEGERIFVAKSISTIKR